MSHNRIDVSAPVMAAKYTVQEEIKGWTVTEGPSILVVNLNALSRVPQWSADIHWPQDIIRINHESETE